MEELDLDVAVEDFLFDGIGEADLDELGQFGQEIVDDLLEAKEAGMEAEEVVDHEDVARAGSERFDFAGLGRGRSEGFFDEDVKVWKEVPNEFGMRLDRGGDVDGIEVRRIDLIGGEEDRETGIEGGSVSNEDATEDGEALVFEGTPDAEMLGGKAAETGEQDAWGANWLHESG